MSIYSLELETGCLSALLQYPDVYADVAPLISENDFAGNTFHKTIFIVIRQILGTNQKLDKVLIAEKINNLNIKPDDIEVFPYLEALSLRQINKESCRGFFEELKKVSARRELHNIAGKLQDYVKDAGNEEYHTIIANCDKLYGDTIGKFAHGIEPIDLFKGLEERIEGDISNPTNEIISPYPHYQKLFGGYYPGDLVVFASRAKSGKSTLLMDIMIKCCAEPERKTRGLILDSELETYRVQRRSVAALAGINEYLLKSHKWRENPEIAIKVRAVWPIIKKFFNRIDHIYIGNAPMQEVASIIKRWHWKNINNSGTKGLIAFDYFKLNSSDNVKDAFMSSVKVGQKVDLLKKLASELQCPILSACQTNRTNEERRDSSKRTDSGSAIALSDEINRYASSVFLFQRKSMDERENDHSRASHKLIPLYNRDLGEFAQGFNDLIKIPDPHDPKKFIYRENYIDFLIENFKVTELGTLRDNLLGQLSISTGPTDDGELE